jgi:hypothetical protein
MNWIGRVFHTLGLLLIGLACWAVIDYSVYRPLKRHAAIAQYQAAAKTAADDLRSLSEEYDRLAAAVSLNAGSQFKKAFEAVPLQSLEKDLQACEQRENAIRERFRSATKDRFVAGSSKRREIESRVLNPAQMRFVSAKGNFSHEAAQAMIVNTRFVNSLNPELTRSTLGADESRILHLAWQSVRCLNPYLAGYPAAHDAFFSVSRLMLDLDWFYENRNRVLGIERERIKQDWARKSDQLLENRDLLEGRSVPTFQPVAIPTEVVDKRYQSWAQYKPGTRIKERTTRIVGNPDLGDTKMQVSDTTTELIEVNLNHVVLEARTQDILRDGIPVAEPERSHRYKLNRILENPPVGRELEAYLAGKPADAIDEKWEDVPVNGSKYMCRMYSRRCHGGGQWLEWRCTAVPGGYLRSLQIDKFLGLNQDDTITEIRINP